MIQQHVIGHTAGSQQPRVLVVDDDVTMCEMLDEDFRRRGYGVSWFTEPTRAVRALGAEFDVALVDIELGASSGLDFATLIHEAQPELPVVMMTGFGSMASAIAAIRTGAFDFITKPIELEVLALAVARAAAHHRLRQEVRRLRTKQLPDGGFGEVIGESRAMRKLFALLSRLADTVAPVLVSGETGTGKEVVARTLHALSSRKGGPFVAVNCAAIPASLLESVLFGHVAGAFTDARGDSPGLFVEADGGTLFLDEIGEMPLQMQTKLLRVLQERCVRPVGGAKEIPFDARVISATNRDLKEDIAQGRFRHDLFYRLDVVAVEIPPLRQRDLDVLLLAQRFLDELELSTSKRVTGLTSDTARALLAYDWPGNVRELRNAIERAHSLTRFDQLTVDDLPESIRACDAAPTSSALGDERGHLSRLDDLEKRHIRRVLEATHGNKTHAARVLGVDRRTLYRMLSRTRAGSTTNCGTFDA